jgi:methylated-DNA-protein-cysteine methyltransferase related protein
MKDNSFFDKVYSVAGMIPRGRITSYGHIAEFIGQKGSARMVGWAMNASHFADPPVPAHRVVNRTGLLTGKYHFQTPDLMQKLLESEGVVIQNDRVVNFDKKLWIPAKELNLKDHKDIHKDL